MTSTTAPHAKAGEPLRWPASQRLGGAAALVIAATYVIGFAAMSVYLVPAGFTDATTDPAASLDFLLDHQTALYLWYLLLYLVGGAAMVVLTIGIHDRVTRSQPTLAAIATAFGLIWAGHLLASGMVALLSQRAVAAIASSERERAEATWVTLSVVQDALGGGIELVGAIWLLLVSAAALRTRMLSRGVAMVGLVIGVAGLVTLVAPVADQAMTVFGLGLIVWFVQAGLELLRR